eukprot:CAMPEP_0119012876 /NCGR_PEP_ID=MMETSP1176-20130426/7672_1 /TAXON_ID=265551 /ORGANISM="Synedropsis recta cf, Strain CCMP1620" /LENGTH=828 /DNA_ID=CAMNT_0006965913 /DNA_START=192 /DNA_END=2678 /DNA_ORIENTATION=-
MADEEAVEVLIAWAPIYVTLLFSFVQGVILFCFFLRQRNKDIKRVNYDLFEPRQYTRGHRSPPPFDGGSSTFAWAKAAWKVPDDVCLRNVGLDCYMFIRFLRLAARMTLVGAFLSIFLIPVYATGEARGESTEAFNQLTLNRVESGSNRLWVTVVCWWIFIAFILTELWNEWKAYAKHRYEFLAKGDMDTAKDYRYVIRVENIPADKQSNHALRAYFEHLFPNNQVRQAAVCLYATDLDKSIADRHKALVGYEKAVAFTKAKPDKPLPMVKKDAKMGGLCGGTKVEAIPHYQAEIARLNQEIDSERSALYALADGQAADKNAVLDAELEETAAELKQPNTDDHVDAANVEIEFEAKGTARVADDQSLETFEEEEVLVETDGKASSTGYVTLTSLRAKNAAIQCEISGRKDRMDTFPASDPSGVIWENATVPLTRQRSVQMGVACFWLVGVLFWAVPVSFVTSIANLNGILEAAGLGTADPTSFWYGLVAGLLPVIFLAILMAVLYIAIVMVATKVIRKKSMPEVDSYTLFWHQLFQFANLWLILIGGSFFNNAEGFLNGSTDIFEEVAKAIPGASVFFMNLIAVGSFGAFGLELSMLPTYGVTLIMGLIQPEAQRTQRMLDDARHPPSIIWGKQLPPMIFVYLVAILYMPIVPIVQIFALVYFGGAYIVWKHQCLHVYATPFEGGGETTWQALFGFLMAAIYMSECVFIAYMGIKEGQIQGALGFVPLVVTILMHILLNRNIRKPLENLSLEVAADVDDAEGLQSVDEEADKTFSGTIEYQLYGQPGLKPSLDEREPMPYRRDVHSGEPDIERQGDRQYVPPSQQSNK